jgi:hypothetical protein
MPGYAKDGKTVCFFRADKKYMTFGFTQEANLTREEGAPQEDKEKTTDRGGSEFVYRASRRDSCFVDTHTLTHSLTKPMAGLRNTDAAQTANLTKGETK